MVNTVEVVVNGTQVKVSEKPLQCKDWFAAKVFREKRNSNFFSNSIFAIFGETEKAYQCILGRIGAWCTTWVPKSLVEWKNETMCENDDTYICESYENAKAILDDIRSFYH